METTAINEMSTDQIEKLLAQRKKDEKSKREAEKKAYEKEKDTTIESLWEEAEELEQRASRLKNKCHIVMQAQQEKLNEYGGIRSNSKGGFSLPHSNGLMKVTRTRDTDPVWDERASKAVELIKDFLADTVKKRDADTYELLMEFVAKNEKGDLEYEKVMNLFKHQDRFTDPRWVNGLQLVKESYSLQFKSFGYEFKRKDANGKWKGLTLNFSSL